MPSRSVVARVRVQLEVDFQRLCCACASAVHLHGRNQSGTVVTHPTCITPQHSSGYTLHREGSRLPMQLSPAFARPGSIQGTAVAWKDDDP